MKTNIKLKETLKRLAQDRRGATMTEYILLVGVVALLAVGAFTVFQQNVSEEIKNQGQGVLKINSDPSDP